MTQPPKARKFHLSRDETPYGGTGPAPGNAANTPQLPETAGLSDRERMMRTDPVEDGFGDLRLTPAAPPKTPTDTPDASLAAKLEAIRAEKLSERQLRIAGRIARLHNIPVASDEEAVLRLREQGIDPSHRAAVGQILSAEGARAQAAPAPNTPAVVPRMPSPAPAPPKAAPAPRPAALPSREELTEDRRAAEIRRIQEDIARRRRRKMLLLVGRLTVLVFLPTLVAGWYYGHLATPLYATHAQFQIQQADAPAVGGGGGLFGGMHLAMNTDSVAVQSYLSSRDAMLRLDADKGFKRAFQDPALDPIKRLAPDATNEDAYALYKKSVRIGYDPTEGMINLEVIAPDPQLAQDFSLALIGYAEGQVDQLTARLREDQMKGALQNYAEAEQKVTAAQMRVQELQQKLGVLDPQAEGGLVMQRIAALEGQLATAQLELAQIEANPRPQASRVTSLRGRIAELEGMIAGTRAELTQGNAQRASLAAISGELRIAESDLATRQGLLQGAAEQLEIARIEANKQVRYLSLSISPVVPDEAAYPKAVQNTAVALLIFAGIYLMLSLTASILREQVSA